MAWLGQLADNGNIEKIFTTAKPKIPLIKQMNS